jgi:hypothetical protein
MDNLRLAIASDKSCRDELAMPMLEFRRTNQPNIKSSSKSLTTVAKSATEDAATQRQRNLTESQTNSPQHELARLVKPSFALGRTAARVCTYWRFVITE